MPNFRIVVAQATCLATFLATFLTLGMVPVGAASLECRATRAAYETLKYGMTYRHTVEVLGCPGRAVTRMTIGETRRATYSWRGTGRSGANLTLSFRNGHLTSKLQLGLQ